MLQELPNENCRLRRHDRRVVVRADVPGYGLGVRPLVIIRVPLEADGEGLEPARYERGCESGDDARIDSAGQENSKRHVGNEPLPNGLGEQRSYSLPSLLRGRAWWLAGGRKC